MTLDAAEPFCNDTKITDKMIYLYNYVAYDDVIVSRSPVLVGKKSLRNSLCLKR